MEFPVRINIFSAEFLISRNFESLAANDKLECLFEALYDSPNKRRGHSHGIGSGRKIISGIYTDKAMIIGKRLNFILVQTLSDIYTHTI